MSLILRSRSVVTMQGSPLQDGAVVVDGERISAVGTFAEIERSHPGEVVDLGECVLLPGLINAHCHLDYTAMRNSIQPQKSFTKWISRINASKRQMTNADYLRSIEEGFGELRRWGTTTVCNLEAFPELLPLMAPPPIRTWWFLELIDIRSRIPTEELLLGALAFFDGRPGWIGGFGLNPHAPYTVSPELYRLCAECGDRLKMPLTTHLAESNDEEVMFRHARGELYEFLRGIGRRMDDCGTRSSFGNAVANGLVGPGWLIAHCNELDTRDLADIAARGNGSDWHIVHCPRSHLFFKHRPFPWRELHHLGVNISLGTDSLASNQSLNLFSELQAAKKTNPWLTSEQLLRTVTVHPAKSLKLSGQLGEITPGAYADLIALPCSADPHEIYDVILANQRPVGWMMVNGKLQS